MTQVQALATDASLALLDLCLAARRAWSDCHLLAIEQYGNGNGVLISGAGRDHFPEETKSLLRRLARAEAAATDESLAIWTKSGRRRSTWIDAKKSILEQR